MTQSEVNDTKWSSWYLTLLNSDSKKRKKLIRNLYLPFYSVIRISSHASHFPWKNQPSLLPNLCVTDLRDGYYFGCLHFSFNFISFAFIETLIIEFTCPYPEDNYWSRSYYNHVRALSGLPDVWWYRPCVLFYFKAFVLFVLVWQWCVIRLCKQRRGHPTLHKHLCHTLLLKLVFF